ncbi:DUF3616 domain-containing protein [Massilia sp. R2A-15]|uniref:DUF3616 domain-containing protein n=1 Tax=Massilia sp. R2A-15 TaxID=3064278 RepID=UPI002735DD1F|nr:DUF3616 domain-containing protein [Massilia sp. R2A-15]WLI88703.1 DUF3616 domain-containing protein [Massilia sp. R2A-15]
MIERYAGLCDASAAVAIGQGHFAVADDELDVLRIYRRGAPEPVSALDLGDYLQNRRADGKRDEADIEGSALIGTRIYWISSHARKGKDGALAPHRWRFFATDIIAATPAPTLLPAPTPPYEALLADMLADPRFAELREASARNPEAEGGLNIEGLAATRAGGLLIGFRNPLPKGMALAIPLLNPAAVIEGAARPEFGDLIRLDLGARGFRSVELVGDDYLIVAGPSGEASASTATPRFALYRWTGLGGPAPKLVQSLDAGSFRPEALFLDPIADEIVLLSDDGDEEIGGRKCKQLPAAQKAFRAMSLKL